MTYFAYFIILLYIIYIIYSTITIKRIKNNLTNKIKTLEMTNRKNLRLHGTIGILQHRIALLKDELSHCMPTIYVDSIAKVINEHGNYDVTINVQLTEFFYKHESVVMNVLSIKDSNISSLFLCTISGESGSIIKRIKLNNIPESIISTLEVTLSQPFTHLDFDLSGCDEKEPVVDVNTELLTTDTENDLTKIPSADTK